MKLNKSKHCLNCKEEINSSNYCPNCGQLNSDKKLTLRQILKDFLGDYFTFDSKFFRSLIPLLLKPGYLTREYIEGKRALYIFPLRLYIFTTFVFFFVLTLNTKIDLNKYEINSIDSTLTNSLLNDSHSSRTKGIVEKLDKEINRNIKYGTDSAKVGNEVNFQGPGFKISFGDTAIADSPFLKYLNSKAKHLSSLGKDGSDIFIKEMINQIPKLMFLLLPIFALILKVIYLRKKILYVEHLVFSLHIHTFFFFILVLTIFISNIYIISGFLLITLIYLFLSIINFYRQSIPKSIVKFFLLAGLYFFAIIPSFTLLMFLAFLSV